MTQCLRWAVSCWVLESSSAEVFKSSLCDSDSLLAAGSSLDSESQPGSELLSQASRGSSVWSSELGAQLCDSTELSDPGLNGEQHGSRVVEGCTEADVYRQIW